MDTPAPTPAPVAVPTTAPAAAKTGAQTTKTGPQPAAELRRRPPRRPLLRSRRPPWRHQPDRRCGYH
ncbi:MAG: hypothetical protein MZV70_56755 [Desulfobacterales bacterium]|nr:hypothetical protein [Desulfobacterales bacterium]